MGLNSTKKCIMPWIHANIESSGDVFPCCRANQVFGSLGNINRNTLEEIWQGEAYNKIRQQMIDGIEPDQCKVCYDAERLGDLSKRMRENELWKIYEDTTTSPKVNFLIPYIDIRYNNICNLKCRSCRPLHSHSIANEFKKLNKPLDHAIIIKHNHDTNLDVIASTLEEVYFCGGEPLLMEDHYKLLDKLIEVENFNVRLRYSTNLTTLKYKNIDILDKWKKFKNISIHASLDGIGKKLEYIRHGTVWTDILENLEIIKNNNIDLKISPVISIFNVLDLDEICSFYVNNNFVTYENLGITVLETPYHYSIQTLHPNLKVIAKNKMEEFVKSNVRLQQKINYIINYMMEKDSHYEYKENFKSITDELDNFRNESFLKTFPELINHYA